MRKSLFERSLFATFSLILLAGAAQAQIIANDDSYSLNQGGTVSEAPLGVLFNDFEPNRNPLTAVLVSGPSHAASFSLSSDGGFTYTHDGSTANTDSFTYQAVNGAVVSNVATVTFNVTILSGGPEASNDNFDVTNGGTLDITAPGVLQNDSAGAGGTLTAVLVSPPSRHLGTFTLSSDGSFQYAHDGSGQSDSFTYQASENGQLSEVATVTLTVGGSGSGGAGSVSVRFSDLQTFERGTSTGTGGFIDELRLLAGATEATVSGTAQNLPASTFGVTFRTSSATPSDDLQGQISSCEKLALIAQGRPDKYDFTVSVLLGEGSNLEPSNEQVLVALGAGELRCSLLRIQNIL